MKREKNQNHLKCSVVSCTKEGTDYCWIWTRPTSKHWDNSGWGWLCAAHFEQICAFAVIEGHINITIGHTYIRPTRSISLEEPLKILGVE